jgi:hypothetical protein
MEDDESDRSFEPPIDCEPDEEDAPPPGPKQTELGVIPRYEANLSHRSIDRVHAVDLS